MLQYIIVDSLLHHEVICCDRWVVIKFIMSVRLVFGSKGVIIDCKFLRAHVCRRIVLGGKRCRMYVDGIGCKIEILLWSCGMAGI